MVQPKTPPLSVRIPPALLAVVDGIAAADGKTRHETIIKMISVATVVYVREKGVPKIVLPAAAAATAAPDAPLRMPRAPVGSLAKKPKGSK